MLGFKRVTIAQHERGLVFRNRSFKTILEPGVYRIFDPLKRVEVQVYDLTVTEFEHARVDFLVEEARATIEKYFTIVELGDREVGVVYKNGRVAGVVAPGKRQLYWRGPIDVRVEKFDISKEFELPQELAKVLVRAKQPLAAQVAEAVSAVEVAGYRGRTADRGRRAREGARAGSACVLEVPARAEDRARGSPRAGRWRSRARRS